MSESKTHEARLEVADIKASGCSDGADLVELGGKHQMARRRGGAFVERGIGARPYTSQLAEEDANGHRPPARECT